LEVNETNWEHKHITLVQHFGKEMIFALVGSDKSNVESSLKNYKDLVPRGWVWGGFMPLGAKSMWAKDMPSMLSPGSWSTNTGVTCALLGLLVFPGSTFRKKS